MADTAHPVTHGAGHTGANPGKPAIHRMVAHKPGVWTYYVPIGVIVIGLAIVAFTAQETYQAAKTYVPPPPPPRKSTEANPSPSASSMKPCAPKPNQEKVKPPTKPSQYNQYLGGELTLVAGAAIAMLLFNTPRRQSFT